MKAVLDTNILVDYLKGIEAARKEIAAYSKPAISIISWMEVMVGANADEERSIRAFLDSFETININQDIASLAVKLRKQYRLRLPDAVIWACARNSNYLLVTRNSKDFPASDPSIRVPYAI